MNSSGYSSRNFNESSFRKTFIDLISNSSWNCFIIFFMDSYDNSSSMFQKVMVEFYMKLFHELYQIFLSEFTQKFLHGFIFLNLPKISLKIPLIKITKNKPIDSSFVIFVIVLFLWTLQNC